MKPYLAKYEETIKTKNSEIGITGKTRTLEETDPDELRPDTILTETSEDTDPDEFKP